jgi:Tol biopolymer transport system component
LLTCRHASKPVAVAAIVLAGCGRFGFVTEPGGDALLDQALDDVPLAEPTEPWGTPQPLTALNSAQDDSDPELRADGLEIIFHSNRQGAGYDLYHSVRATTTDPFPPAVVLGNVNTAGDEIGPSLSADGLTLLYSDGFDIYYATRPDIAAPFTSGQPVVALSSMDADTAPELSGDGRIAMVTRGTRDTRDIYVFTRGEAGPIIQGWSTGVRAAELASSVTDGSPDLDRHGLVVHLHSDRDTYPLDEIYVAVRASILEPFGPPTRISGGVNTSDDEGDPTLSADRRTMVFHRNLDLFMVTR